MNKLFISQLIKGLFAEIFFHNILLPPTIFIFRIKLKCRMQLKYPFSDLSPFHIREGISIKYIYCRNYRGWQPQSPTLHPFLRKKQHFFPFYIVFFFFYISRRKFPKRKIWCGYVAGLLLLWFMQPKHTGLFFCSTFPEAK